LFLRYQTDELQGNGDTFDVSWSHDSTLLCACFSSGNLSVFDTSAWFDQLRRPEASEEDMPATKKMAVESSSDHAADSNGAKVPTAVPVPTHISPVPGAPKSTPPQQQGARPAAPIGSPERKSSAVTSTATSVPIKSEPPHGQQHADAHHPHKAAAEDADDSKPAPIVGSVGGGSGYESDDNEDDDHAKIARKQQHPHHPEEANDNEDEDRSAEAMKVEEAEDDDDDSAKPAPPEQDSESDSDEEGDTNSRASISHSNCKEDTTINNNDANAQEAISNAEEDTVDIEAEEAGNGMDVVDSREAAGSNPQQDAASDSEEEEGSIAE
jgi:hypothetical protein